MKVLPMLTALAVAGSLSACGSGTGSDGDLSAAGALEDVDATPRLQSIYDECSVDDSDETLTIGDGGYTITVDTRSEYGDFAPTACVLAALGTPSSITAAMESTTALMGVQKADDDGVEYSWSYHPDNGVNMVITEG